MGCIFREKCTIYKFNQQRYANHIRERDCFLDHLFVLGMAGLLK